MAKSKILIFSSAYLPRIGGSELAIKNITDRLPDFEFELITARFKKEYPKNEKIGNVNIHRVGSGMFPQADFMVDKFLLPILGFLRARKFQDIRVVHAYQASYGAGAAWLTKLFNKNLFFVVTLQEGKELGMQSLFVRFFRSVILQKADRATAISNYLKDYILGIRRDLRVDMIPNGVDIESFSKNFSYGELTALDNKLGLQPDDKVIISSSRLVPKNGLDLLVKAMAVLNKNSPNNYKLVLVGDGPMRKDLELRITNYELRDKVIFAGEVKNEELPLYLKIADVFVRPSRSEGLGISFLEAMAAGVPIIATRVGGIPDFLEDRKTGLFCTLEPEDIAFKIRIILENNQLRQELIIRAYELVKEKYNWDKIAKDFGNFYRSI